MPTIYKPTKKPNQNIYSRYHHEARSQKYYGSKSWKMLRNTYIAQHPLCEECLKHNIVTPAEHVHHQRPFLSGETEMDKWKLLLDGNNLMSLCHICHNAMHNKRDKYRMASVNELTDKEYNDAHYIDYK